MAWINELEERHASAAFPNLVLKMEHDFPWVTRSIKNSYRVNRIPRREWGIILEHQSRQPLHDECAPTVSGRATYQM